MKFLENVVRAPVGAPDGLGIARGTKLYPVAESWDDDGVTVLAAPHAWFASDIDARNYAGQELS